MQGPAYLQTVVGTTQGPASGVCIGTGIITDSGAIRSPHRDRHPYRQWSTKVLLQGELCMLVTRNDDYCAEDEGILVCQNPLLSLMFRLHRVLLCLCHPLGKRYGTNGDRTHGESLRHGMGSSLVWDNIYSSKSTKDSSHFDWFCGYKDLQGLLLPLLHEIAASMKPPGQPLQVLDLGCGTSDVGLGLFCDSHVPLRITCIDRSKPAVLAMREVYKLRSVIPKHQGSHLEYVEGDVTDLRDVQSGSISLVLDKGTTDALLRSGSRQAQGLVQEALRVLQVGGKLVQLTDEDPDARLGLLEKAGVTVTFHPLGDGDGIIYYAYIVTRSS
ncbi:citrate synthase-lysine N-methyltransferase CSKMT, mitochondrial isoform X2 [Dendropsophus ebraccatus]